MNTPANDARPTSKPILEPYVRACGSKYDSSLHGADLTKAIRADMKAAVKSGKLPKLKLSVRLDTGSMYQAVYVTISGFFPLYSVDGFDVCPSDPREIQTIGSRRDRFTPEAAAVLETVKSIVLAYQRSESHAQADYYNTNFFDHVEFSHADEVAEFDRVKTALLGTLKKK